MVISIIVLAFSWPTVTSEPKEIPLMIAGPEQQVEMALDQLEDAQADLFDITTGEDRDTAVEAIEHRDVYGAIVIGRPAEVISASANNAATGQILQRVGEQTGMPVTQTDLIPFSENDPNGAGLSVLAFPMVMGGLAGGIVIGLMVIGGGRKVVAVLVHAVLAGFAVTALGGPLLKVFQREFELTWLAVGLAFAAMSATSPFPGGRHHYAVARALRMAGARARADRDRAGLGARCRAPLRRLGRPDPRYVDRLLLRRARSRGPRTRRGHVSR